MYFGGELALLQYSPLNSNYFLGEVGSLKLAGGIKITLNEPAEEIGVSSCGLR